MANLIPGTYPAFIEGYLGFLHAVRWMRAIQNIPGSIIKFFKTFHAEEIELSTAGKMDYKKTRSILLMLNRSFLTVL